MKSFIIFMLCLNVIGFPAKAENLLPNSLILDGRIYEQYQLMDAFLDTVFNGNIATDNNFPKAGYLLLPTETTSGPNTFFEPGRIKEEYPWIYEYLYREKGNPRYFALNKWKGNIRISTGMPNDLKPAIEAVKKDNIYYYMVGIKEGTDEKNALLEQEISALMPELERITGLNISYLAHDKETNSDFGNIRIVFLDALDHWETKFKMGTPDIIISTNTYPKPILFREHLEPKLHTAVRYTPSSFNQVDGYFLANAANEIEFAVCYIWNGHGAQMILGLIRECLIRSLGLSDATDQAPQASSSLWNDPERWIKTNDKEKLSRTPPLLTEFDKFLLSLLYAPQLRSGMSITEAQKVLLKMN